MSKEVIIQVDGAIISTNCRNLHGDDGARKIAINQIDEQLKILMETWGKDKESKFELKLFLHRKR